MPHGCAIAAMLLCRHLAELEEDEGLLLTPFERNLEVWRQLWRVLERSDIVVQVRKWHSTAGRVACASVAGSALCTALAVGSAEGLPT